MARGASKRSGAIVVAVGPNPREIERLRDLADSIAAHEPEAGPLVLVDDHPEPRDLSRGLPPGLRAISLHHRRPARRDFWRSVGICSVIMHGLQWIQANTDTDFILKLDTDSLVIAPYRDRVLTRFAEDPGLGIVGAYETEADGKVRDWSVHTESLALLTRRFDWRHPRGSIRTWNNPLKARARSLLAAAQANGYRTAEHCLGGGYAVSRLLLDAMASAGFLDDPGLWAMADLPEDVMVGLHARALGFGFADATTPGEVFGVTYIGLAAPPADLLARRHAVIHAVKNDPALGEADIRAFFRAHRIGAIA